jgi:hypothetical protein
LTIKPIILAPREQLTDGAGNITRSWWRALNGLFQQSGTLATPLVTKESAILSAADLSSGGTIAAPNMPGLSLIGNPANTSAQPAVVHVGGAFAFNGGTIDLALIPPTTLFGNGGSVSAAPGDVAVGNNLTLTGGTLAVSSSLYDAYAYSIRDTRGEVNDAAGVAGEALNLAHVNRAAPATVNNDTLKLALLNRPAPPQNDDALKLTLLNRPAAPGIAVAPGSLFGNAGTATAPGASLAVGTGLTLSSSTGLAVTTSLQKLPLAFAYSGKPLAGQISLYSLIDDVPISIPAAFAGTRGYVTTNPTATATFTLAYIRSGTATTIGTVAISTAGALTLTAASTYTSVAADTLRLTAPATQDATLADLCITFEAARA